MFPSRAFRHSAIYIRTDRGIRGPRDLAGRLVGVREYSMTAALVARGVLEDDFGLRAAEVRWRYGPADVGDSAPIVRVRPNGVELVPLAGGEDGAEDPGEGRAALLASTASRGATALSALHQSIDLDGCEARLCVFQGRLRDWLL